MVSTNITKCFKPLIIFANCIGAFPVSGVTSPTADDLRFRWSSLKVIYSFVLILNITVIVSLLAYQMMLKPSLSTIGLLIIFGESVLK